MCKTVKIKLIKLWNFAVMYKSCIKNMQKLLQKYKINYILILRKRLSYLSCCTDKQKTSKILTVEILTVG